MMAGKTERCGKHVPFSKHLHKASTLCPMPPTGAFGRTWCPPTDQSVGDETHHAIKTVATLPTKRRQTCTRSGACEATTSTNASGVLRHSCRHPGPTRAHLGTRMAQLGPTSAPKLPNLGHFEVTERTPRERPENEANKSRSWQWPATRTAPDQHQEAPQTLLATRWALTPGGAILQPSCSLSRAHLEPVFKTFPKPST